MRGQRLVVLGILSAIILSITLLMFNKVESNPGIIYVDDSGGADYTSIQDAIGNAVHGDTIYVYSGNYQENIVIDKEIHLIGEDRNDTIIDGGGHDNTIDIQHDNVTIQNLKVTKSASDKAGIQLGSYWNKVKNCIVSNCVITNNYDGMFFGSRGIIDKSVSTYDTIINNSISNNYDNGMFLQGGFSDNIIKGNIISNNNGAGIELYGHNEYNNLTYNTITQNARGIYLHYHTNNNLIGYNNITDNYYGIRLSSSSGNTIFSNNIIDNNNNAEDDFINGWDNGTKGNYWSDWNRRYSLLHTRRKWY